jgi:hypothetical protein
MLSNVLIVAGVAILSMALRSYRNRVVHRLGTIGIFVTSFLAGWLIGGHVLIGAAFASSWLLLPWLEILTRVRKLRLPIRRRLEFRTPPAPAVFPNFGELTEEIEAEHFEHVEDVGWQHENQQQFYRVFYQAESGTESAICLIEQDAVAFSYVSVTTRRAGGGTFVTWDYPFSYGLKLAPSLKLHRVAAGGTFAQMLAEHRHFLDRNEVGIDAVQSQTSESLRARLEEDMHDQIVHNIDLGLLIRDGEDCIRYSVRGMVYLWVQFLRDLVRLS